MVFILLRLYVTGMVEAKQDEINRIKRDLTTCGYPSKFVNECIREKPSDPLEKDPNRSIVVLPYVQGLSEELKRILTGYNFTVFFKPLPALRGQLCRVKDPTPELNRSGVVYKIPIVVSAIWTWCILVRQDV